MVLELTDMAPTGEAIGRHEGMVIFVPLSMPGERVEVELVHRRRNYARARLLQVLRPAPERVQPPCPYFGRCGGCEWQHIELHAQRMFKTRAVKEQLSRIGKLPDVKVLDCLGTTHDYHYRNHIQLALTTQGKPGYHQGGTTSVIEITECPTADPKLNELLHPRQEQPAALVQCLQSEPAMELRKDLREMHLRNGMPGDAPMIVMEQQDDRMVVVQGPGELREHVHGHDYTISPGSFFQVNTYVAGLLVDEVMSALAPRGTDDVLDLYCGVALFTLPISETVRKVLGVEASAEAIRDASANLSGRTNTQLIHADVRDAFEHKDVRSVPWSAVVLDPPRAGVAHDTLVKLLAMRISRVIYVSCDPATLARDARMMCDSGYTLGRVQPLDMFPQTHHVETVATFTRLAEAAAPVYKP